MSWSLLELVTIELVMPSNRLVLCHPLLLLPSIFPSIRVLFSNELALWIRWPKYWSFSFSISPSNEYSGLISFRIDWLDLLAVQRTLKSLLQHDSSKPLILQHPPFIMVQPSYPYVTTGKTIALTILTFVSKVMSLLFNTLFRLSLSLSTSQRLDFRLWSASHLLLPSGLHSFCCHLPGIISFSPISLFPWYTKRFLGVGNHTVKLEWIFWPTQYYLLNLKTNCPWSHSALELLPVSPSRFKEQSQGLVLSLRAHLTLASAYLVLTWTKRVLQLQGLSPFCFSVKSVFPPFWNSPFSWAQGLARGLLPSRRT